ncbi:hypothetical protein BI344_05250 [Chromobacterium sphagni]|uniref:Sce7726 family protein n=1 Tax=Chromobacterium sphagni TaxID=1903179 RepID=A0ABX3CJ37_9NEIS|nr:hypothetical protein BI344_05250 [Chromobacterium sphagni]
MEKHYRYEYVYKNSIATKIAINRHSPNTTTSILEFQVNKSKADLVIVNGTSSVYEIKTEYDSFDRLNSQIADYKKVFDKINIVTHEGGIDRVAAIVDETVGLIYLDNKMRLKMIKAPESNISNIDQLSIFHCLRQGEYLKILKELKDFEPQVPAHLIYGVCKEKFLELTVEQAHLGMVKCLKIRGKTPGLSKFINCLPRSLRVLGLAGEMSVGQQERLLQAMEKTVMQVV